jgi:hypothetical protein
MKKYFLSMDFHTIDNIKRVRKKSDWIAEMYTFCPDLGYHLYHKSSVINLKQMFLIKQGLIIFPSIIHIHNIKDIVFPKEYFDVSICFKPRIYMGHVYTIKFEFKIIGKE